MLIRKGDTSIKIMLLMIDSTDHISAKTGLTPTVTRSKNGSAFGALSGSVAEAANGWYAVTLASGDVDTNGPLAIHATGSGADPTDVLCQVSASVYTDDAQPIPATPAANTRGEAFAAALANGYFRFKWDGAGNITVLNYDGSALYTHVVKDRAGTTTAAPASGVPADLT